MITVNVARALRLKGIARPLAFLTRNGFIYHTARKLLAGTKQSIDLSHMEQLCRILHCEPYDLLDYKPSANVPVGSEDHLAFLKKPEAGPDIYTLLSKLPLRDMSELTAHVTSQYAKAS